MIPGLCPGCGLSADLDVFALQAGVPQVVATALRTPKPIGERLMPYLRLFSPPKKQLAFNKIARLLTELNAAVDCAEVKRNGIVWSAPLDLWCIALESIVANPPTQLPLTNHNYLFQVVANLAAKAANKAERQQEEQRKHRSPGPMGHPSLSKEGNQVGTAAVNTPLLNQGGVAPSAGVVKSGPPPSWLTDTLGQILHRANPALPAQASTAAADPREQIFQRLRAIAERLCELNAIGGLTTAEQEELLALQQEEQQLTQEAHHG